MVTSTKNRLEVANTVLLSVGERIITSSTTSQQGRIVTDSIKNAIYDFCTSFSWGELRSFVSGTWVNDKLTLSDRVYRVSGVYWYSSPTGSPASTYDYPKYPIQFVTIDSYLKRSLTPYTNSAQNRPYVWSMESPTVLRVNPYPNDTTERSKISVDAFSMIQYPTSDGSYFECSDQMLNAVELKAASFYALKFTGDAQLSSVFNNEYETARRKLLQANASTPTGGYNLFRSQRL